MLKCVWTDLHICYDLHDRITLQECKIHNSTLFTYTATSVSSGRTEGVRRLTEEAESFLPDTLPCKEKAVGEQKRKIKHFIWEYLT